MFFKYIKDIVDTEFEFKVFIKYLILIILSTLIIVLQVEIFKWRFTAVQTLHKSQSRFLVNTKGCHIQALNPFDDAIQKYIFHPQKIVCNNNIPSLFISNLTHVFLKKSSLEFYMIEDLEELKCCYTVGMREKPKLGSPDDSFVFEDNCTSFKESAEISNEFIKVECTYDDKSIYIDMFSFISIKSESIAKSAEVEKLNVLIFGLDGISRLNFIRQLPETLKFLKDFEALEMVGYNKVGDTTFSNIIPLLTGKTVEDIENTCWKERLYFDNCSFIWDKFKRNGYMTAYGEDLARQGLFNFGRFGFLNQPTDYAYGYFNMKMEELIGNSVSNSMTDCVGDRPVYEDLLQYIVKFVYTMDQENLPYFGFFWSSSLSHEDLNKCKLGDRRFSKLIRFLKINDHLRHTIFIFLSDQGMSWGDIRRTYQGKLEENLPFNFILTPKWIRNRHKEAFDNLARNSKKLITSFDLHETLIDVLNFGLSKEKKVRKTSKGYGVSLFEKLPDKRTCEDAGIASAWCSCQQSAIIESDSYLMTIIVNFLIRYINKLLESQPQCATLSLYKILGAREIFFDQNNLGYREFIVTWQAVPGKGIFEATVRKSKSKLDVQGTISRLNFYANQSNCITSYDLKLYCFCTESQ